jgi:cell division protein FtsL
MRGEHPDPVLVIPKAIDNSQVVREVDPRSSRDLFWLLALVAVLVGGLTLYAWPHFQLRQTSYATEQMAREKERLLEENRKLRLEKATLENLGRVETIAVRDLGLAPPSSERVVVVESTGTITNAGRVASRRETPGPAEN